MNYQHNDKDDPQDYEQLFSHSFDINNNDYLSQSMPTFNQQQYDNNSNNMFDFLNLNQDDFVLTDNLDPSIFLEANNNNHNDAAFDLETQQAILLSDPTFLRQQQLLQEEQQKFQQQHYQNQQQQQPPHNFQQQQQQQPPPMRSNLSAMLENNNTASGSTMKPIPLISSQQQKKDILDKTMNGKITKPIPISSSSSPINTNIPPSFGIDHQRRFNELQARFRINKKPKQQTSPLGTSMPTNSSHLSTSYTDNNRRRLSLEPVSSSKSVLRLNGNKIKVTTPTDPIASSFPSRTMPIQIQRVHRSNGLQNHDLEQRQKKLDDQLVKADFDDITVSELKEMLRQRGKPATGKKAVLLQRLIEERDLILHARANNIPILNRNIQSSPSPHAASLPDSMYLSSSPTIGSLNRSIADMHIGSPPMTNQQSRRFAPYSTSPRLAPPLYSSSVPTTSNSLDMMMMQEPARVRGIKKSYAPFTSSALATPDREDDVNPFDTVKEETANDMEWTDPTLDFMLQQGVNMNDKELLSFLTNQGSYPEMNFNPDLTSVMYDDTDNKSNM